MAWTAAQNAAELKRKASLGITPVNKANQAQYNQIRQSLSSGSKSPASSVSQPKPAAQTPVNNWVVQDGKYKNLVGGKLYDAVTPEQQQRAYTQLGNPNMNQDVQGYRLQEALNQRPQFTYQQPQQMNYDVARSQAEQQTQGLYANKLRQALDNAKNATMGSGFFGQPGQIQLSADTEAQIGSEQSAAVAELARAIQQQDFDRQNALYNQFLQKYQMTELDPWKERVTSLRDALDDARQTGQFEKTYRQQEKASALEQAYKNWYMKQQEKEFGEQARRNKVAEEIDRYNAKNKGSGGSGGIKPPTLAQNRAAASNTEDVMTDLDAAIGQGATQEQLLERFNRYKNTWLQQGVDISTIYDIILKTPTAGQRRIMQSGAGRG